MKRLLIILFLPITLGYGQQFEFPSKEGKLSLISDVGLIEKNKTFKFTIKALAGADLFDLNIISINGSIAHSGEELHINVADESIIYILAMTADDATAELTYYDLIGVPISPNEYPYIVASADQVPINLQRGISGNTKDISMQILYNTLQGSCQEVFVNQISVTFSDRNREVGVVREQAGQADISSLLSRGASPHLQVKIVAEGIACKDDKGVVKAINPKFNRTFTYNVTASNLDKDVTQLIDHINAENRRQAAIAAEN